LRYLDTVLRSSPVIPDAQRTSAVTSLWHDYSSDNLTSRQTARDRETAELLDRAALQKAHRAAKKRLRPSDTLIRAAVSELLRPYSGGHNGSYLRSVQDMVAKLYPADVATTAYIEKAAVNPAMTSVAGWAQELVQLAPADFLQGSGQPVLAALASLGAVTVSEPAKIVGRNPVAPSGGWVAEGAAKPVASLVLTSTPLAPTKICVISSWSEEVQDLAIASIEALVRDSLQHDLRAILDTTLLDSSAATSVRPAGLWSAPTTAVTPSASTNLTEACIADLQGLAAAVALNAPDAKLAYIMHSKQSIRVGVLAEQSPLGIDVIVSNYMTAGNVGCIDVNSLALMLGDIQFQASTEAALHMDTAPTALSATGSPNTIAAPLLSFWQAGLLALKSQLVASWVKRRTGCTALCSSVLW
jgi:hypothetical protein